MPTSVFAEEVGAEGSAAIQLGADAISVLSKNVNTATAPTVYFGQNHDNNPAAWRVIGYDGNGVTSAQGYMILLAAGNMGVVQFADGGGNNEYAPSHLKTAIDALAAKLTTKENAAVKKRTLTSGSYNGENTDCVAGGQVDNAVFWPLSTKEANAVKKDLRVVDPEHPIWASSFWWLRSPNDFNNVAAVNGIGTVGRYGSNIISTYGVRPAFNLNLNAVLFASAAVGEKPDGGLSPIPEYTGNEWKLTLLDNSNLPDSTLHYVPFTYAGTVGAYKLTSETATTEEYARENRYEHSLFIANHNVTHTVSRNDLNTADLIFGKGYVAGGVGYTLRAPSVGSGHTGSGNSERGTPKATNGIRYWTRPADISKTGSICIRVGKIVKGMRSRTERSVGTYRLASGITSGPRIGTPNLVSAPSLKS